MFTCHARVCVCVKIMKNSDMPIAIVTHKITNTSGDFVLDPKGKKDVGHE